MIAVSSKGQSFRALAAYLVAGRTGMEQGRIAWSSARNLPTSDPELAGTIMRATAEQSVRVRQPVYHLVLSFDPHDPVDRAAMERLADRVLQRLGLTEHQAVIVAHQDRAHAHVHVLVNRVHPVTGRAWEMSFDYRAIQEVLRAEERVLGLREVPGRYPGAPGQAPSLTTEIGSSSGPDVVRGRDDHGIRQVAESGRREGEFGPGNFAADGRDGAQLRSVERDDPGERVAPSGTPRAVQGEPRDRANVGMLAARAREQLPALRAASTWGEVEAALGASGLRAERRGGGLVFTDGSAEIKASAVARDLSLGALERRLGVPYPDRLSAPNGGERSGQRTTARIEPNVPPSAPSIPGVASPPSPAVEGIARELALYERRIALTAEQLQAAVALSAARARAAQFDAAVERADSVATALRERLAAVYRDPAGAERMFRSAAERDGAEQAARRLREVPEQFGALRTVERPRVLGLGHRSDEGRARGAAADAAVHGQTLLDAERALTVTLTAVRMRRLEDEFTEALRGVFREPSKARVRFGELTVERGTDVAAGVLRGRPADLGPIHDGVDARGARVQDGLRTVALVGIEWVRARTAVNDLSWAGQVSAVSNERDAARDAVERAARRERGISGDLRRLPGQAVLERSIGHAMRRLTPVELRQLEMLVTNPQRMLAAKFKQTMREAVLGREEPER